MSEWYYTQAGQQQGPVSLEQLKALVREGSLDTAQDLVWNETMKDWTRADQVPDLYEKPTYGNASTANISSNPYAPPQSSWEEPVPEVDSPLSEIIPGSNPFDAWACVKRAFELCKRNAGTIIVVGLIYMGILWGVGMLEGVVRMAVGVVDPDTYGSHAHVTSSGFPTGNPYIGLPVSFYVITAVSNLISQAVGTFLSLGTTRIGLNMVSGKTATVGMMFGEGRKFWRAFGATILFYLAVVIGSILLIVPGIYIAVRYGQYMNAIVDRDMGITEAFSYSSSITTNNRWNLVSLWFLGEVLKKRP